MRLRLEAEATQARQSLADRKLIERARGQLMDGPGLSETDALTRLQHAARGRDARLRGVVREVIDHHDRLLSDTGPNL